MRKLPAVATAATLATAITVTSATSLAASTVNVGDNYFVRGLRRPHGLGEEEHEGHLQVRRPQPPHRQGEEGADEVHGAPEVHGTYRTPKLKAGTYTIVCPIHGGSDQKMKLKVE